MSLKPLVSVIIPTYNRSNQVIEAVHSVLHQSYSPVELFVIDDGSTDKTFNRIKSFVKNNNLRYFYQQNKGVSAARNLGIKHARGEYISFLDSDDLWDKRKLELQIDFLLSQSKYEVCYTDEIWIRKGVRVNPKRKHQKYSGQIYKYCLPLCIISPSSILMKRDVLDRIGLFDECFPACEDYDYWLRLTSRFPIYFLNEKLIIKRGGHPDQLSQKYSVMDRFRIKALIKMIENNNLEFVDYKRTLAMIVEKCEIVKKGCYKRDKRNECDYYASLINKYSYANIE